jgi:hypothetical protein
MAAVPLVRGFAEYCVHIGVFSECVLVRFNYNLTKATTTKKKHNLTVRTIHCK